MNTTGNGYRLRGVQTIAVFEILQLLGGMDQNDLHTVELIEVTNNEPPEDFKDSGHQTAGKLEEVYLFAKAAGHDLHCCGIEARPEQGGTHWIIGCYYTSAYRNKFITRYTPEDARAGGMRLCEWINDSSQGYWIATYLKEVKQNEHREREKDHTGGDAYRIRI